MAKVCIIGHFGKHHNLMNGQTIKTEIVSREMIRNFGSKDVVEIDTYGGIKSLVRIFIKCGKAFKHCDNIVMLPAYNGVRALTPIILFYNLFYKRCLHYIVIGGWLPQFLEKEKRLKNKLMKYNHIYVETYSMKYMLNEQGFSNVEVMYNCKNLNILCESELIYTKKAPYRLCTFSRVMKEKGIEEAIEAIKYINKNNHDTICKLDIFGQIDTNQKEWFENLRKDFPDCITYKGCVSFENTTDVLKEYYALLFPTYYNGEGFAGTIIDAFAAGIPVIASDWKYNSEIIDDNSTGLLYDLSEKEGLITAIESACSNPTMWNNMKKKCIDKCKHFTPQNAMVGIVRNCKYNL